MLRVNGSYFDPCVPSTVLSMQSALMYIVAFVTEKISCDTLKRRTIYCIKLVLKPVDKNSSSYDIIIDMD